MKNTPTSEQLQARTRLFASFSRDYPDLLQSYVDVLRVAVAAEERLRALHQKRYNDAVNASNKLHNAATAAAFTAYRQATGARFDYFRQAQQDLRDALNRDIQAANDVYQAAEKIARQGVNERFAALELQLTAMHQAAIELRDPAIAARGVEEYQAARGSLIAEITEALAPARAVYDRCIADMHTVFQAETARLDAEMRDYDAPHVATRTSQIDADKARHARVSADAYMRRYHSETALDHLLISQAGNRLDQLELFMQTGDRARLLRSFAEARQLFHEQVETAMAEESQD
ncbi:MAG: hypothetical protein JSS83_19180 [Cyanobacteria bacterium SZAS LIN-3]|nr:hypothetical protein [Cyanobacteria bacterium SZAS LIN-3]